MTPELKKEIEDGLKSSWSPEQICGRYQLEQKPMVAFKTIYNWLYAGLIDLDLSVLRRKGKTRQPKETRGTFRIGTSIAKRPKEVRNRETFGHWERLKKPTRGRPSIKLFYSNAVHVQSFVRKARGYLIDKHYPLVV